MVVLGVGFLKIFFLFLHINMHHHTGTEKGSEHTWFWEDEDDGGVALSLHCVLCFRLVCFLFSPFCSLTIFPISPIFFRSPKLYPFCFCSLSSLSPLFFWCGSSSGFYSQRTPAFLVSRRASRCRGMSTTIPAPLIRE